MDFFNQIDKIAMWLASFGIWAILISLLLGIFITILGVVPTLLLTGTNAIVFGFMNGFLISLSAEVIGSMISFWLYRWGLRQFTYVKTEKWKWVHHLNQVSRKRSFFLLILARLTPIPSGVITFATAVSHMKWIDFGIATLIGKTPFIVMETFVGHDLLSLNENLPRFILSVIILVILYVFLRYNKRLTQR